MRIVIKLGTSLLTNSDGQLNISFLKSIVSQCAEIKKTGHELIIVTSGAVGAGRSRIKIRHEKQSIPYRQALAAVGQGVLMKTYHEFFGGFGLRVAQALLTNYDFVNRENFLNTKNVLGLLLQNNVIPIVNENDVTTIAELKFGDNDMLSAKTAAMVSADLLIICTDVDGLYVEDPKKNPNAALLAVVPKIDESVKKSAGGAASNRSLGGMKTKLEAAEYVTSVGIPMIIANGTKPEIFKKIISQFPNIIISSTFFPSLVSRLQAQKKWLKPKIQKNAWIEVDSGAAQALTTNGKSLLATGVVKVSGKFERGDVVLIKNSEREIGYGQTHYAAEDLDKIKKHRSSEIEQILGYSFEPEIMHRDRLVITG